MWGNHIKAWSLVPWCNVPWSRSLVLWTSCLQLLLYFRLLLPWCKDLNITKRTVDSFASGTNEDYKEMKQPNITSYFCIEFAKCYVFPDILHNDDLQFATDVVAIARGSGCTLTVQYLCLFLDWSPLVRKQKCNQTSYTAIWHHMPPYRSFHQLQWSKGLLVYSPIID